MVLLLQRCTGVRKVSFHIESHMVKRHIKYPHKHIMVAWLRSKHPVHYQPFMNP
jgi:hypothetical protein